MINYKDAIGYLYLVRERIREVDVNGVYEYYCPKIRTTNEMIKQWESVNSLILPDTYKAFLLTANGWKSVSQDKDLLSLEELTLSKESKYIETRDIFADIINDAGDKSLLLPIAASDYSYDIYLMVLDIESEFYGQVIWVAGEEIERYSSFEEFFLSLIDYNKYNFELISGRKYED